LFLLQNGFLALVLSNLNQSMWSERAENRVSGISGAVSGYSRKEKTLERQRSVVCVEGEAAERERSDERAKPAPQSPLTRNIKDTSSLISTNISLI